MFLNINNPVYNTILIFSIIMILVYITKPDVVYDNEKEEFRQFGTSDGKTLLPIYVIGILMAIILYVFFHYISLKPYDNRYQENRQPNNIDNNIDNNINNQILSLQNQINQLLQQQMINTHIQQIPNSLSII